MPRPLLQLAVDVLSTEEALRLVAAVHPYFDIVEVGTPLIIEDGLAPVAELKRRYPDKQVLADLKIMDAGKLEANSGFARGADVVTILGVADDATIQGALAAAREHGGLLMADLIGVPDLAARATRLAELGVPILCAHTAYDRQDQGLDPLAELETLKNAGAGSRIAIAGGLKLANIRPAADCGADIVVVGGGILGMPDPRAAAQEVYHLLEDLGRA